MRSPPPHCGKSCYGASSIGTGTFGSRQRNIYVRRPTEWCCAHRRGERDLRGFNCKQKQRPPRHLINASKGKLGIWTGVGNIGVEQQRPALPTRYLHLTGTMENAEDAGTLAYLEDTARQAGLETALINIEDIGLREDGNFVGPENRPIELAFKLYPWEWMFRDEFGAKLPNASTRWIEPPWKAVLSNKGILPLL
jgi:hypothetical protein